MHALALVVCLLASAADATAPIDDAIAGHIERLDDWCPQKDFKLYALLGYSVAWHSIDGIGLFDGFDRYGVYLGSGWILITEQPR